MVIWICRNYHGLLRLKAQINAGDYVIDKQTQLYPGQQKPDI